MVCLGTGIGLLPFAFRMALGRTRRRGVRVGVRRRARRGGRRCAGAWPSVRARACPAPWRAPRRADRMRIERSRRTRRRRTAGAGRLLAQARPIGHGARFHPPGHAARSSGAAEPRSARGWATHVEVFAANRVVIVAAGIGTRPPLRYSAGRITPRAATATSSRSSPRASCSSAAEHGSRSPICFARGAAAVSTAVRLVRGGPGRSVRVFVDGRRGPARPGAVPLSAARGDRARGRAARPAAHVLHIPARKLTPVALFFAGMGPLQRGGCSGGSRRWR